MNGMPRDSRTVGTVLSATTIPWYAVRGGLSSVFYGTLPVLLMAWIAGNAWKEADPRFRMIHMAERQNKAKENIA